GLVARPASAQTTPPATPPATRPATMDHGAMNHGAMDHGAMSHDGGGGATMDAFHTLLMKTWHPAKATNDLAPTRTNAEAMAVKAAEWAAAPVPATCKPETKATVGRIATDMRALAGLVAAKGTDEQVKSALSAIHDSFEAVEKGCAEPAKTTATPPAPR